MALLWLDGLDQHRIGDVLGRTLDSVKWSWRQVNEQLRAKLLALVA